MDDQEKIWKKQGNSVMRVAAAQLRAAEEKEKKRRAKAARRKGKSK